MALIVGVEDGSSVSGVVDLGFSVDDGVVDAEYVVEDGLVVVRVAVGVDDCVVAEVDDLVTDIVDAVARVL